jgi:hypothetical protein
MHKHMKILVLAGALVAGLAIAPRLHAGEGAKAMMMGEDGMMAMMKNMMGQNQMMEQCSQMMQGMMSGAGAQIPNERWRRGRPAEPGAQD